MTDEGDDWPPEPTAPTPRVEPDFRPTAPYKKPASGCRWSFIGAMVGGIGGWTVGQIDASQMHRQPNNDMDYGYYIGSMLVPPLLAFIGFVCCGIVGAVAAAYYNKHRYD